MCRQRNSTRNANDVESGSLLEPVTGVGSMSTNGSVNGVSTVKDSNGEVV